MTMPVSQFVYASTFVPGRITSARSAFQDIIRAAQTSNDANEISGCLIFDGRFFVQMLEGDSAAIENAFQRLRRDRRHRNIAVIGMRSDQARSFGAYPMIGLWYSNNVELCFVENDDENRNLCQTNAIALASHLSEYRPHHDW
ncbi:BLUF domain-containing protein [Bosea sp. PAMC 26642]|uniref:BLUF domain-containing protein n=1 Tax=Bosea sp. (strain PAMC 26642) TaxID=1792307 RepID=UPI0009E7ACD8|nr:BLUF domain-containing protein [Bosea sp. PAMC 26642]